MFKNFSLDKLTNSITTAAQQVEESLKNNSILPTDVPSKLSLKKTSRFFQEKVGTISEQDISKLPESYTSLEKKTDQLVKILKKIIIVTKTYEIDGYDYPPNLPESLNDWWSQQPSDKKTKFQFSKSFASAISKSAYDSKELLETLNKPSSATNNAENETEEPADEEEEEEEDEDLQNLIKVFDLWFKSFQNIDKFKSDMDTTMIKEFNTKVEKMIQIDYKNIMKLRAKVEDSRLEFDTVRHDVKVKEQEKAKADAKKIIATDQKEETRNKEEKKEEDEDKSENKEEKGTSAKNEETKNTNEDSLDDEDDKLLEKLEDEFVTSTTRAAETMLEFTDNSDIISLVKLFQKTQLDYYKKCSEELEKSLNFLNEFETEESTD